MATNHERRSKLVGFTISQHAWHLEDLKRQYRQTLEALENADKAVNEIESAIDAAEDNIRGAMKGETPLDLSAIEAARQFVNDQVKTRKKKRQEQNHFSQQALQTETALKQEALYIKALEQVKENSDREIVKSQEKKMNDANTDLWMQRYGRKEWDIYQ